MANAREQYLQAMASFTEMTRTRAERLASRLARQGDLQSGQVGRFAEDLVRRTQRNRETMTRLIQREVKRQLSVIGIATRDEVARLQQRVRALEQEAERQAAASRAAAASTGTAASRTATATRKPTASRSTTSATTRKPAASRSRSSSTGAEDTTATGAESAKATGTTETGSRGAKAAGGRARKAPSGGTGTGGGRRARGSSQTGQDRTEGE